MTTTSILTGVALWFGLNVAFVAWRLYLARPARTNVILRVRDELVWDHVQLSIVSQIRLRNRN